MKRSPRSSSRRSTPRVTGTIHCSVLDTHGDLGCTTTTSGLSWKIPGRVGDSPILGAGLFLDNEFGSAGSTGVGELNLLNLSSAMIVEGMRRGLPPKDAIMEVCKTIVTRCTKDPKRRRKDGRLAGNVSFYALSKDGKFAGGSIYPGARMAVHDGDSAKLVPCDPFIARAPEREALTDNSGRAGAVFVGWVKPTVSRGCVGGFHPPDSQEHGQRGDARDCQPGPDLERGGVVLVDEPMLARPDQRTSHRSVGPEDLGGPAVDQEPPAGVIHVGQDHQAGRLEMGDELDPARIVADDLHLLGCVAARAGEPGRDQLASTPSIQATSLGS